MNHDSWIAVLDFGSQYSHLIARRIREQKVYSELIRFDTPAKELAKRKPSGVILSGGPSSVFEKGAPVCDPAIYKLGIPILGICYGMQLTAKLLGGLVKHYKEREYGHMQLSIAKDEELFKDLPATIKVWMSHGDQVHSLPQGFKIAAETYNCPIAAMSCSSRHIYGVQFHPEVVHTQYGTEILKRFVFDICHSKATWEMSHFVRKSIAAIRKRVGSNHVVCAVSGGVDSSVVAALVHKAIGNKLHCIFVDTGLMHFDEAKHVEEIFETVFDMDLTLVNASERFLSQLQGIVDPEKKRKLIGKTFIDVFSEEARKLGDIKFLAQGTLYPDVIESISPIGGPSKTIKTHHNVGGLPEDLHFQLIEPLRELFKDEVRILGRELGLPDYIVERQPFPGPGMAVRILGEVTAERVAMLQQADIRVQEELKKLKCYRDIWQSFAILLPVHTVGVMGDSRTYENVVALRIVESSDAMTADFFHVPYDVLGTIANRIINEVSGINRVVYDISSKPPATIEWE